MTPTGYEPVGLSLPSVIQWLLDYIGITQENLPDNRNARIRERFALGEALSDLAREFGISPQRVYQIVRGRNH